MQQKKPYSISMWAWGLNEELLVEEFIKKSDKDLRAVTDDYEILLIDDGSTDSTWNIMQRLAGEFTRLKIFKHEKNMRPGYCMRTCLEHTTKEIVFWNTVDSFFNTEDLPMMLKALETCDMVQGVRSDLKANNPYRKLTHKINYYLIRYLYDINLGEFQNVKFCYFSFLKEVGLQSASMFTNPECAIKAFRKGKTIREVSMVFHSRKAGKAKGAANIAILESIRDILYWWFRWIMMGELKSSAVHGKIYKLDGSIWPKG